MTNFEERLVGELKQVVTERAAEPAPAHRRTWSPRLVLAGGVAAALAAGTAIGLPLITADRASPAWAVTTDDEGTVSIKIFDHSDAEGLERKLVDLGIAAEVDYVPPGKNCKSPRYRAADNQAAASLVTPDPFEPPSAGTEYLVRRDALGPDDTLVIEWAAGETKKEEGKQVIVAKTPTIGVATGPVKACELVPADG